MLVLRHKKDDEVKLQVGDEEIIVKIFKCSEKRVWLGFVASRKVEITRLAEPLSYELEKKLRDKSTA